jgi:hypothetical protein
VFDFGRPEELRIDAHALLPLEAGAGEGDAARRARCATGVSECAALS